MRVQITKKTDGLGVLRCVRADGSVTWQKQTDRQAAYFALHDLTHFVVETTLGLRRGLRTDRPGLGYRRHHREDRLRAAASGRLRGRDDRWALFCRDEQAATFGPLTSSTSPRPWWGRVS